MDGVESCCLCVKILPHVVLASRTVNWEVYDCLGIEIKLNYDSKGIVVHVN